jgi:hypothetical protein
MFFCHHTVSSISKHSFCNFYIVFCHCLYLIYVLILLADNLIIQVGKGKILHVLHMSLPLLNAVIATLLLRQQLLQYEYERPEPIVLAILKSACFLIHALLPRD